MVPGMALLAIIANLQLNSSGSSGLKRVANLDSGCTPSLMARHNADRLSSLNSPSSQIFAWTNQPLNPTTNGSLSGIN